MHFGYDIVVIDAEDTTQHRMCDSRFAGGYLTPENRANERRVNMVISFVDTNQVKEVANSNECMNLSSDVDAEH